MDSALNGTWDLDLRLLHRVIRVLVRRFVCALGIRRLSRRCFGPMLEHLQVDGRPDSAFDRLHLFGRRLHRLCNHRFRLRGIPRLRALRYECVGLWIH